jgi:undecaprenyl-diphosphatase
LDWPDPGLTFDVALHLGTLAALVIYFFNDWVHLTRSAFRIFNNDPEDTDARLALYILLATIPGGIAGLLLEHLEDNISTPAVIAAMLIAVALLMRFAEISGRRKTDLKRIRLSDAMMVGLAQALAIIPGVSRSGVTITAGLLRGLTRKTAAQFSFLLSAPIVAGAALKKVIDIAADGLPPGEGTSFAVGIIFSAFWGVISIAAMMRYLQNRNTFVFVNYRIVLGVAVLVLGYFGGMQKPATESQKIFSIDARYEAASGASSAGAHGANSLSAAASYGPAFTSHTTVSGSSAKKVCQTPSRQSTANEPRVASRKAEACISGEPSS